MPRSALMDKFISLHAQLGNKLEGPTILFHGWEIAASFGDVERECAALRNAAGLAELSYRGRIAVSGEDAARFLHGMVKIGRAHV